MPPLRVKSRAESQAERPRTPSPFATFGARAAEENLPEIADDDSFRVVVKKLSIYISQFITLPSTFEQLRTTAVGDSLRALVQHLSRTCTNPAIVNALLALKWHYGAAPGDKALNDARANSCEIVAWRFLTHLSEREAVDFCLYEIPDRSADAENGHSRDEENGGNGIDVDEHTALLHTQATPGTVNGGKPRRSGSSSKTGSARRYQLLQSISRLTMTMTGEEGEEDDDDDPTAPFVHLNALEIAAVADAKHFLSQGAVQKIVTGIWNGDIVFWDSLSVHATKRPRFYDDRAGAADVFARLRVPKYLKSFEVVFFASFLCLYYAVLVERDPLRVTPLEVLLYVWLAAFFFDELSEWIDAGSIMYAVDVWNLFDMIMISIGIVFAIMRIVGLSRGDQELINVAFDVLALEALFMVPRVCSILSLSPYWGTLIPCLKEMGKDFIKFMVLVVIIYLGFLTTFSLVGRDDYTFGHMAMVLTKIFFGSSPTGLDLMHRIDPIFGPPLMLIFVTLSSILLMGSLTGMLSNSFSRVITHAREEYLYVYSVYVLEASTSNRLTHFYPPFNLVALAVFRPLRLVFPSSPSSSSTPSSPSASNDRIRAARILLLKITHLPIVAVILLYESVRRRLCRGTGGGSGGSGGFKGPQVGSAVAVGSNNGVSAPQNGGRSRLRSSFRGQPLLSPPPRSPIPKTVAGGDVRDDGNDKVGADGNDATAGPMVTPTTPSGGAEGRIASLEAKIDRLTELVVVLQVQHARSIADAAARSEG